MKHKFSKNKIFKLRHKYMNDCMVGDVNLMQVNFNFNRSIERSKSRIIFGEEIIPLYYLGIIQGLKEYNIEEVEFKTLSEQILDRLSEFYKVSDSSLKDKNTYHFAIKANDKRLYGIFEMYSTLIETYDIDAEINPSDQIISEIRIKIDFGQLSRKDLENTCVLAAQLISRLNEIFKVKLISYFFTNKSKKQVKNERELRNYIEQKNLFYSEDGENYKIFLPADATKAPVLLFDIAKM